MRYGAPQIQPGRLPRLFGVLFNEVISAVFI
jgi:hypothetical protein